MVKIIQPQGINYMIRKIHYSREQAQEYIDMLVDKSLKYMEKKRRGVFCAPLMTIDQINDQMQNILAFKIVECEDVPPYKEKEPV